MLQYIFFLSLSFHFALSANRTVKTKWLCQEVRMGGLKRALQNEVCEINTQNYMQLEFSPNLDHICTS